MVHAINSVSLDAEGLNRVVRVKDIQDVILVNSEGTQNPLGVGGYLDIGIIDTMKDLFVNFIGAVFFSVIGAIYVKGRDKKAGIIASQFIPKVMEDGVSPNERSDENEEKEADAADNKSAKETEK